MQKERSWVSLYSREALYAKALTLPKAPLSPNGVETKETVKSGCTEPERKGAPTQLLAKTSSCSRSNRQAPSLSSHFTFSFPRSVSFSLVFSHYFLFVFSMPAIKNKLPPCMQVHMHTIPLSHNLCGVMTQHGAQRESRRARCLDVKSINTHRVGLFLTSYLHFSLYTSLKFFFFYTSHAQASHARTENRLYTSRRYCNILLVTVHQLVRRSC